MDSENLCATQPRVGFASPRAIPLRRAVESRKEKRIRVNVFYRSITEVIQNEIFYHQIKREINAWPYRK